MLKALLVLTLMAAPGLAYAQDVEEVEDVDLTVARALFEQGLKLFHQGHYADALQLFRESLARSPGGPYAASAQQMVERCEDKLGIKRAPPAAEPEDPYGADVDPEPENPYGDDASADTFELEPEPVNPYAALPVGADTTPGRADRLMLVGSGAVWGVGYGILLAAMFDDPTAVPDDQPQGDYVLTATISGAIGAGVGLWLVGKHPKEGDVALTNSFGGYGLAGGLMLGVLMDPAQDRAYAVNGFLGASIGLGTGLYLAGTHDVSRLRMGYIDLGVGAGAATPWVLFALLGGSSDGAVQFTGAMSVIGMGVGGYLGWRWTRDLSPPAADDLAFGLHPTLGGGVALDLSGRF
jgi:hypothetical protein